MTRDRLLVLEAVWDEDFSEKKSVRPFIEGWATQARIGVAYRTYGNRHDLRHWLERFREDESLDTAYIAGHGVGTRLVGLGDRGINVAALILDIFRRGRGPGALKAKGLLVGACQCFGEKARTRVIQETNRQLSFIGGYAVDIPFFEATVADLLLLEFRYRGRVRRRNNNTWDLDQRDFGNIRTVANWVITDLPMSKAWGFGVAMRSPMEGKEKSRWRRKR